jgi:hypothetical protein
MFDDFVGKPMLGDQDRPERKEQREQGQREGEVGQDPLGGLLGGQGSSGDLGALLALGGAGAAGGQSGGLGDLLGGMLGGGGQTDPSFLGNNAMANPLVDMLADKLGISRQTAGMIMSVAVPLIIGMLQKQSRGGSRSVGAADLNELLDQDYLRSSGAVSQLASQSDLDEEAAAQNLQQAMAMLVGQTGSS